MILLIGFFDSSVSGEHQGKAGKEKECSQIDQDKKDRDLALMLLEIMFCNEIM